MDALKLLTSDHDKVRDLFKEFRAAKEAGDSKRMHSLQETIFEELEIHTRIEEDIFYPAVRALDVEELTEMIDESLQEHHVVDVLIREVTGLKTDDVFAAKMTVLIENVEHHADEEESDMFPEVRSRMDTDQLEELGDRLEAAKAAG